MKVESLRILSKKRKQSQRTESTAGDSGTAGSNGKGVKRALPGTGDPGRGNNSGHPPGCKSPSGSTPNHTKLHSGGSSPAGSSASKESQRRRFAWSEPLHQDFVAAVFDIGLKCASPKLLLEMMPVVDGLTSEHIKSHLQKYRLHRQRSREEFLKSYGYLTDLDGGKGLGGGSAAAAIKAAAAAAGDVSGSVDVKGAVPRCSAAVPDEVGCGASCACEGGARMALNGGNGEKAQSLGSSPNVGPTRRGLNGESCDSKGLPKWTPGEGDHGGTGGQGSTSIAAGSQGSSSRVGITGSIGLGQVPPGAGAVPAVTSVLLQSHLELLAKGIDMQVQFHHYLREVVNSQKALQAQLLEHPGNGSGVPLHPGGFASPTLADAAGMVRGTMQNLHVEQARGQGKALHDVQRRLMMINGKTADESAMAVPVAKQDAPVEEQAKVLGVEVQGSPVQGGLTRETVRGTELGRAGSDIHVSSTKPAVVAVTASPQVSARAGPAHDARVHETMVDTNQRAGNSMASSSSRFNLAAIRAAVSVRPDVGGNPPRSAPSNLPAMTGIERRAYVPGDYTLNTKSPDAGAAQNGRGEEGTLGVGGVGGGGGAAGNDVDAPRRDQVESRVAVHGDDLAEPALAVADGQDPRMLQRRMQAQMEMQRAMLEACVDQATLFKTQRTWSGQTGVVPVQVAALAKGDAVGANAQGSGDSGNGGSGIGDGANAAGVPRYQSAESLPPVQPADPIVSTPTGFLPAEDVFNLDWLDHGGEFQQGDATAPRCPIGETQSLFSFLME